MKRHLASALVGLGVLVGALPIGAIAQTHGVPPSLLNNIRRLDGDRLQVCLDTSGRTMQFDKAIAGLIAEALFLEADFHEGFGGYPTSGDGFLDELQIAMTNSCDIMMGMTVQASSPFPEWATLTRPYVSLPYVTIVRDDHATLGDIGLDRPLGTALGSMGERVFITWNQQRPRDARYTRFPYADMELMATRVLDGSIAGGVIWAPAWARLQETFPPARDLKAIPMTPIPDTVTRIGVLLKTRDSYLRSQIDQTIDALVADGSIQALMDEFGYEGTPGDDSRAQ